MGEHKKRARPSTEEKHQKGQARQKKDAGGEKGDRRRGAHFRRKRKRPPEKDG
jgi:hypothetical protein